MRCCECEVEPLTPGHYCECCGRKLSLQERKALETVLPAPARDDAAPAPPLHLDRLVGVHFPPQSAADYIPAVDVAAPRPLIDPILEAHFAGHVPSEPVPQVHAVAHQAGAPAPVSSYAGAVAADAPADVSAAHSDSDVPAARCEICAEPAADEELCAACRRTYHSVLDSEAFPLPADAAPASVPALSPALVIAGMPASQREASPDSVAVVSAAVAAPVAASHSGNVAAPPPVRPPVIATAVQSRTPRVETVSPQAPLPAARMPLRQPSPARTIAGAAAAVVVVAAIGFPLGRLWLGHQEAASVVRDEANQPAMLMSPAVVQVSATSSTPESSSPAQPRATAPLPPRTGGAPRSAAARLPSRTSRPPTPSARPAAAVAIPSPVLAALAPEIAAPAAVVAPAPTPEAPAAAVGPFFELRDVNDTPKIATRVEPHVPDELRDRPLNEVAIVRVLVTQTGHPQIVNLLRRSKAGPSLDNAIVAAVKQWTFVPARKRGQAVSCWYHVGVPVTTRAQ